MLQLQTLPNGWLGKTNACHQATQQEWVVWTWGTAVLSMLPWSLRAGTVQWSWLSPIAALVIQAAGCWGLMRQFLGYGLQWKGWVVARKL